MFLPPESLASQPGIIEGIEKASLRLVVQALVDFREDAEEIISEESDFLADMGEDITREALDRVGVSRIEQRLFGKMDYKRARYIFHDAYALRQALFVDSKAEKNQGRATATLQIAQTSMKIRQFRRGRTVEEQGKLPKVLEAKGLKYLTTTVFVKYNYVSKENKNKLVDVVVAALPNGMLQGNYNPDARSGFWTAG